MHLRLLPEKGKYKFRGVKMEMLCISPIRIAHGKKERMRTSTDFCVNFIQRDETSQE